MKKQELKMYSKIVTIIASIIGLFVFVSLYLVLPIPRGNKLIVIIIPTIKISEEYTISRLNIRLN